MSIVLGSSQYGKAEIRLVRVDRSGGHHALTDLTVTVSLAGDQADTHLTGDNAKVLTTDAQKNTVYAFARDGVGQPEDFALRLARHFVDAQPSIHRARVSVEAHGWRRLEVDGRPAPHSFARDGAATRLAVVTYNGRRAWVVSGVTGLTVLNSTDSEFRGFVQDPYTTLEETTDRILATSVDARWRHREPAGDWEKSHRATVTALLEAFAGTYSRSLQQTLYAMGRRALTDRPELAEIRLSLPNRHHFLVDLAPFGRDNPGEVYYAADRPYGLIEGTVCRDDAPDPGLAW